MLILGIGNCLMADDGIGVHAARRLAAAPPPGSTVTDVGTDFLSAVPFLEQHSRVLVIDAMDAGEPPGTMYRCRADAIETPKGRSLHELGLLAMLEFVAADRRPEIHFLGVQPARIEYSLELSPRLAEVLPAVVKQAGKIAAELTRQPPFSAARSTPAEASAPARRPAKGGPARRSAGVPPATSPPSARR